MLNVLAQTAALLAATANPDSLSGRLSLTPPIQAMSIAEVIVLVNLASYAL